MVRRFRNKVKVSDVQAEFDKLTGRIDRLNQIITDVQAFGDDFDYSIGSTQVGPAGYTLTVGAMKYLLDKTDGRVIGAKAFKTNDNKIKMTTGLLIANNRGIKLPDSVIDLPSDNAKRTLYYNIDRNRYQWNRTGGSPEPVHISSHCVQRGTQETMYDGYVPAYYLPNYDTNKTGVPAVYNPNTSYNWHQPIQLTKMTLGENSAESVATGSVKLNIGYFPHVLCEPATSTLQTIMHNPIIGYYSSCMVFGTLDSDGKTFTPKFVIEHDNEGSGIGGSYHVNLRYGTPTISYYNDTQSDYVSVSFSNSTTVRFTNSNTDMSNKSTVVTITGNSDNGFSINAGIRTYTGSFMEDTNRMTDVNFQDQLASWKTFPLNLEELNINCVLFGGPTGFEISSSQIESSVPITKYAYRVFTDDNPYYYLNVEGEDLPVPEEEDTGTCYRICDVNINRDSAFVNTQLGVQCQEIYGNVNISTESRMYDGNRNMYDSSVTRKTAYVDNLDWLDLNKFTGCYEQINNNNEPKFCVPLEALEKDDNSRSEAYFNNIRISYNKARGRATKYASSINFMFLPKGISNPFNYKIKRVGWDTEDSGTLYTDDPRKASCQKEYNVKISKNIKQKTS